MRCETVLEWMVGALAEFGDAKPNSVAPKPNSVSNRSVWKPVLE